MRKLLLIVTIANTEWFNIQVSQLYIFKHLLSFVIRKIINKFIKYMRLLSLRRYAL